MLGLQENISHPNNVSQEATGDAARFSRVGADERFGNSWPRDVPRRLSSKLLGCQWDTQGCDVEMG
jgi:hypothetical protein